MEPLYTRRCEVCRLGTPVIKDEEANPLLVKIPAWRREFHEGVEKLIREFHFVEFKDAFDFTYKVATLSERENHHPALLTEWGKVTVYWWPHQINGLHLNDFIMAAKTDMIARSSRKS